MNNYVFGKMYKTKCGKKVVCTNPLDEYFRDSKDELYYEFYIESEWHEPEPKRKVKLYAYLLPNSVENQLIFNESVNLKVLIPDRGYTRIPSEDKEVEVPE